MMMFFVLAESFLFLFALTNVNKHRHCQELDLLSVFGACAKKCQQAFLAPLPGKQLA